MQLKKSENSLILGTFCKDFFLHPVFAIETLFVFGETKISLKVLRFNAHYYLQFTYLKLEALLIPGRNVGAPHHTPFSLFGSGHADGSQVQLQEVQQVVRLE
jgi:hypothetical protein